MDCPNASFAQWDEEPVSLTRAVAVSPWRVECNAESEGQSVRWDWIRYKGANTSRSTLQVRRLLWISDFTLLKHAKFIQQQIWIDAGWMLALDGDMPNPLFPLPLTHTHLVRLYRVGRYNMIANQFHEGNTECLSAAVRLHHSRETAR